MHLGFISLCLLGWPIEGSADTFIPCLWLDVLVGVSNNFILASTQDFGTYRL